jgi:hypothetical protein
MNRFSIDNRRKPVSFEQYMDVAERLDSSLKKIRPNLSSEVLLTTNGFDYHGWGSLTIINPMVEEAWNRRERYSLQDLTQELWNKSFETNLCIKDKTLENLYMVSLTNERREPKSMNFYGQDLDDKSQEVFDSFAVPKKFQKIGNGFSKSSPFAVSHAIASLGGKRDRAFHPLFG